MSNSAAKQEATETALANGHQLDRWNIEAGRPTAVCACGGYAAIERTYGGMGFITGRLPISGARFITSQCTKGGDS